MAESESSMNDLQKAEAALRFISSDERDVWVSMGMALQSSFGDAGRDVWMDWSRESRSFNELSARSVWRSFRGTGITLGTLLHEARQNGWRDTSPSTRPTAEQLAEQRRAAEQRASREGRERARMAQAASEKAKWILDQCKLEAHAYLHAHGYADMQTLVWRPDEETNLMCIPMYVGKQLVGVQMIDKHGDKKYLSGQITSKAEHCFDSGSANVMDFWVEGFCSGLSLKSLLAALKIKSRIHVTFSAGNLKRMAHSGVVIADNDTSKTGEKAAIETGLPYWMSDVEGEDINDLHRRLGLFKASQQIGKWLRSLQANAA